MERKIKQKWNIFSIVLTAMILLFPLSQLRADARSDASSILHKARKQNSRLARYEKASWQNYRNFGFGRDNYKKAVSYFKSRSYSRAVTYGKRALAFFKRIRHIRYGGRKRRAVKLIRQADKGSRKTNKYRNDSRDNQKNYAKGNTYLRKARRHLERYDYFKAADRAKTSYSYFRKVTSKASKYSLRASLTIIKARKAKNKMKYYMHYSNSNRRYYDAAVRYLNRAVGYQSRKAYFLAFKYALRSNETFMRMIKKYYSNDEVSAGKWIKKADKEHRRAKRYRTRNSKNRKLFKAGSIRLIKAKIHNKRRRFKNAKKEAMIGYNFLKRVR